MNKIRVYTLPLLLTIAILPLTGLAQSKDQREKIDRMAVQVEDLKTELVLLQRTTQTMQDTFNKTMGELNTLIVQMSDNISAIRRAQESVSTKSGDVTAQVTSIGERVTATNERMERLSEQFAQVKKLIEDYQKGPVMGAITPGNPDQLFASAYADYSRGNYDLAISEFRQYVESYPSSEMTDNAQYWIGEILYAQKKLPEASAAFEQVKMLSPNGDKTASALFRRATILLEMGRKEEAVVQLLSVFKDYSKTKESELAYQKLMDVAPEALSNTPPTRPPGRSTPVRRPNQ
ncbi:MAG TPA: tol-pal system protein YbgF [Blastocatellia bacterium]|jgi:tol-pal system protein YbgF|nr:tol-pal system protein YbgF [Blastocatellia bacterium]